MLTNAVAILLGSMMMSMEEGSPPNFVSKPSIRVDEGKLVFECPMTADPEPSILWLLNNKPVATGGRITIKSVVKDNILVAIMEISKVTLNDAGQYQCIAKNARGEAAATIALSLEGKLKALKNNIDLFKMKLISYNFVLK